MTAVASFTHVAHTAANTIKGKDPALTAG